MNKIYIIIVAILSALDLLSFIVSFVAIFAKKVKKQKLNGKTVDYFDVLFDTIEETEAFGLANKLTGSDKLNIAVASILENYAKKNVLADGEQVKADVERLIDFSKKVNFRDESAKATTENK